MAGRLIGMRIAVPLAVVAASLQLVAGCGADGSGGDVAAGPDDHAARQGTTELTIVVSLGPGRGERTYLLRCDPPGGDHPDPQAACRSLAELENPFAPVPHDAVCTEIYGGPQTATVTGTVRGERIDARFTRTDGCQIARWDEHAAVLVEGGGVEGGPAASGSRTGDGAGDA